MVDGIGRIDLIGLLESGNVQVVDVLPAKEYDESHIPGAVSIPLKELTKAKASVLSPDKPVVVYCHDGL